MRKSLARGWETHLTIVTEALVPTPAFFPLIDKLAAKANTQLQLSPKCLWGRGNGWSRGGRISLSRRICIFVPRRRSTRGKLIILMNVYVAAPDHLIYFVEPELLSEVTRKYRGIAVVIPLVSARC